MINVTIQQSKICTGSKGTQQDNTPSKWAQEKCNLFDTLHKRGKINWTYRVIIFLSLHSFSEEPVRKHATESCFCMCARTEPLCYIHGTHFWSSLYLGKDGFPEDMPSCYHILLLQVLSLGHLFIKQNFPPCFLMWNPAIVFQLENIFVQVNVGVVEVRKPLRGNKRRISKVIFVFINILLLLKDSSFTNYAQIPEFFITLSFKLSIPSWCIQQFK